MFRDIEMQDAPTILADDEKTINHVEGDRWNREEIYGSDCFPMVVQERKPALS